MILLTGASGFIGKHLLAELQLKFGVDNIIAMTSKPISSGRFVLHKGYNFSQNFVEENGLEEVKIVVHAGAFTPKSGVNVNNWMECNANVTNTDKLYSLSLPNLRKLIYLSTLDVYASDDKEISEKTIVNPATLYGLSKLYCEKMTLAFSKHKNIVCQVLRIGHTYGPGEEEYQKVIPNTMKLLLKGANPQVFGSGNELRAFIFIDDVVRAIVKSLSLEEYVGEINVVSENTTTINKLIENILEISGQEGEIEYINKEFVGKSLSFDTTKLKKFLLESEISLQIGLEQEYNYLKDLNEKNIL